MPNLYLCNTDFEFELTENQDNMSIEQAWNIHKRSLLLQYLPILYANQDDAIAVTQKPDNELSGNFILLSDQHIPKFEKCISWGASKRVLKWCQERNIPYEIPNWEVVKQINSKEFSFIHSKQLPGAMLLRNKYELQTWLKETTGKRVLKTCFGLSGTGHHFVSEQMDKMEKFCEKEWMHNRPIIAEPWVNRFFDFSTQWFLDQKKGIQLVGPTVFESNDKGVYKATLAGAPETIFGAYLPFLKEHQEYSMKIIQDIFKMGFFGSLGVDAFLYHNEKNEICLQPIVEINGRQTMSLAALLFQRKHYPNDPIRLYFSTEGDPQRSLLPSKKIHLFFEIKKDFKNK